MNLRKISIILGLGLCMVGYFQGVDEPITREYYVDERIIVDDEYYLVMYNIDDVMGVVKSEWDLYRWQVDKAIFDNVKLGDCLWITKK